MSSVRIDGDHSKITKSKTVRTTQQKDEHRLEPGDKHKISNKKRKRGPEDSFSDVLDMGLRVNHAITQMDSELLVDLMMQKTKRYEPHLSFLELQERRIPGIGPVRNKNSILLSVARSFLTCLSGCHRRYELLEPTSNP